MDYFDICRLAGQHIEEMHIQIHLLIELVHRCLLTLSTLPLALCRSSSVLRTQPSGYPLHSPSNMDNDFGCVLKVNVLESFVKRLSVFLLIQKSVFVRQI